jgi:hypothetical protein
MVPAESAPVAVRRRLCEPLSGPIEVVQDPREQLDGGWRSVGRSAHRVEREPRAGNQGGELLPRRREREDVLAIALDAHTAILPHPTGRDDPRGENASLPAAQRQSGAAD